MFNIVCFDDGDAIITKNQEDAVGDKTGRVFAT
jgi:hypothetical protein